MSGHVSWDEETDLLQISFPYSPQLVELVKKIPRRRWDRVRKVWLAPGGEAATALRLLRPRGFTFSPEVEELAGREPTADPGATPASAYTVSQLNQAAAAALDRAFPGPVWLIAELDRIQVRGRGHCYLELLEKQAGGDGVAATLPGVIFARDLGEIEARLAREGAGLELEAGLEVRLLVKPDLFPARGRFQAIIKEIDPAFTLGKLAARREEILRELDRLGLRERNLSLPFPPLPLRVALITSAGSNAATDFTGVLERSGWGFRVDLADARMQGEELEEQVCRALDWFARRAGDYDVLVIVRGGGSPADLAWFDNLAVATRLARHPLKALMGIGHSQDQGVLDRIAAAAATPTAAAEDLVARVEAERERFRQVKVRLGEELGSLLAGARRDLTGAGRRLEVATRGELREEQAHLQQIGRRLAVQAGLVGRGAREELARLARRLPRPPAELFRRRREELGLLEQRLRDHDPRRVLARGFALVKDEAGRVLREAGRTAPGAGLRIELARGKIKAKVQECHEEDEA